MSVVACPKCAEKVTLPPRTPPAAKVRCPLCGENYLLEEAMSTMPPMLEVLELPQGYQPAGEVDISTEAFLKTVDRPAVMDDADDLKLAAPEGNVAVADDELTPTYDEWGPTRSTEPAYAVEASSTVSPAITPPELLQTPVRRKKKQINPIFHIIGIVGGGIVAIPVALFILLWLPGSWRRDPLEIGKPIGEYAPFLVPADFRPADPGDSSDETTNASDSVPAVANKNRTETPKRANGGLGGEVEPEGKSGLRGSEFENALKDGGFSLDNDASTTKTKTKTQPQIDDPLDTEPVIDDSEPKPTTDSEPTLPDLDRPESKPETDAKPDSEKDDAGPEPEAKPEPQPKPEPEDKPEPAPEPETKPEADADPDPEPKPELEPKVEEEQKVTFELPSPSKPADPLAAQKLAVSAANQAFDSAATLADKKGAAIALYRTIADLAEKLPSDATIPAELDALTSDAKKLQFVGVYAATWQENGERATPGIVLSGTVKECQAVGERFEVRVELPSRDKRELLLITAAQCQPGQKLFVAGRFVMNARDMISGYSGEATMAIDARVLKVVE